MSLSLGGGLQILDENSFLSVTTTGSACKIKHKTLAVIAEFKMDSMDRFVFPADV